MMVTICFYLATLHVCINIQIYICLCYIMTLLVNWHYNLLLTLLKEI